MTGPELATLSTIGWAVLTLACLVVFGSWSAGESWTILPGLVRGVRDWATERAIPRQPSSPSPWSVTMPEPTAVLEAGLGGTSSEPTERAEIEDLWERPTR